MADTQFFAALEAFAALVITESVVYVKAIVAEVLTDIVTETPIDTAGAKASWAVSVGAPVYETAPTVTPQARLSAQEAEARALATLGALGGFRLGDTVYISNGRPYISGLEEGRSQQSSHMVARALAKQAGGVTGGTP